MPAVGRWSLSAEPRRYHPARETLVNCFQLGAFLIAPSDAYIFGFVSGHGRSRLTAEIWSSVLSVNVYRSADFGPVACFEMLISRLPYRYYHC